MKTLRVTAFVTVVLCLLPILAMGANTGEFPIAAKSGHNQLSLSAAFDGTNYLVGLEDSAGCPGTKCTAAVKAQIMNGTTGAIIGAPVTVTSEAAIPSVAFGGGNYLVVWKGSADAGHAIYGQRVSTSGALTGSKITISPSVAKMSGQHDIIRVLFDGTNFFAAWEDRTEVGAEAGRIYGQFVTTAGDLLGAVIPISDPAAQYGQVLPAMETDGSNIFVVWIDGRNQKSCSVIDSTCYPSEIYGQFVTTSITGTAGALSDFNFAIYDSGRGLPRDRLPSIAWSGTNYFILSQERNAIPGYNCPWNGCIWDVSGIFVTQAGSWEVPHTTYGFSNYYDNYFPTVTWDGSAFLIAWTKRLSASKYYIETSSYYPDRTWASGFSLTTQAGGTTAPWAAVALPQGTGKPFFALINRGKPGKTWNDIDLYTGGKVYGTILADLEQIFVSEPPASTQVSQKLNITDTVQNVGFGPSLGSATVYMFSPTTDPNDAVGWFSTQRKVPSVPAGGTNTGTASVTIPTWMPAGTYYLIACADYGTWSPDIQFTNNCKASTGTTVLSKPDLTETSFTNEDLFVPSSSSPAPPHTIAVTDTITNQGGVPSTGSTTRYYLSPSASKNDPGAVLLTPTRSIPPLAAGASSSSKKTTVKINLKAPALTMSDYNLLACTNDTDKTGKNGPNNCKVSSTPAASISCSACH